MKILFYEQATEKVLSLIINSIPLLKLKEEDFTPWTLKSSDKAINYKNSLHFINILPKWTLKLVSPTSSESLTPMVTYLSGRDVPKPVLVVPCLPNKYTPDIEAKITRYFTNVSKDPQWFSIYLHEMVHLLNHTEDNFGSSDDGDNISLVEYISHPEELDAVSAQFAYAIYKSGIKKPIFDCLQMEEVTDLSPYSLDEVAEILEDRNLVTKLVARIGYYL